MKLTCRVNLIKEPKGSTKAFASLNFEEAFVVGGLRVVEGSKGLFVSMPQQKTKDKDGNDKYSDLCYPLSKKAREYIEDLILKEYKKKKAEKPDDDGFVSGDSCELPFY